MLISDIVILSRRNRIISLSMRKLIKLHLAVMEAVRSVEYGDMGRRGTAEKGRDLLVKEGKWILGRYKHYMATIPTMLVHACKLEVR